MKALGSMIASVFLLLLSTSLFAQEGNRSVKVCLMSSATADDDSILYLLSVAAMAHHPMAKSVISTSESGYESLLKKYAATYKRLVYVECRKEIVVSAGRLGAKAAMADLNQAFEELGKRATLPVMNHPEVNKAYMKMSKYFDEKERQTMIAEMMDAIDNKRTRRVP